MDYDEDAEEGGGHRGGVSNEELLFEKEHLAFEMKHDFAELKFLGFSQRRFIGFRNRYEFEKKRILVGNRSEFSVIGYDHRKHVFELLRHQVEDPDNEEIVFIDFLEDSQPVYVMVLSVNTLSKATSMRILQIKKEDRVRDESQQVYDAIETDTLRLTALIKDSVREGDFEKRRKKAVDNFELVPKTRKRTSSEDVRNRSTGADPTGLVNLSRDSVIIRKEQMGSANKEMTPAQVNLSGKRKDLHRSAVSR